MAEVLSPVIGICVSVGCIFGAISGILDAQAYDRALSDPDHNILHLVDEMGNPVSQKAD